MEGHPFRIRYMVPLIAVEAVGAGVAAGLLRRDARGRGAAGRRWRCSSCVAVELRPLDATAPMVVEAQWDRPNAPVRAARDRRACGRLRAARRSWRAWARSATTCRKPSRAGFAIRDFLHEGNGDIWLAALDGPRPFAGWILIEEKAEGGRHAGEASRASTRSFSTGYSRVCEGAGLALYRREPRSEPDRLNDRSR